MLSSEAASLLEGSSSSARADQDGHLLEPLGISEIEERLYRALLARPHGPMGEIADDVALTARQAHKVIASLEAKGLVSRLSGKPPSFVPAPPDIALEALIRGRQEQLERLRVSATEMVDQFRARTRRGDDREFIEVITGREAVTQRVKQMEGAAHKEVLIFNKPPYEAVGLNETEAKCLARGVSYRVIYDREALEIPNQLQWITQLTSAGEQARILSGLPMKLVIADRRLAAVPLYVDDERIGEPGIQEALIVHPGSLLDALAANFETLWDRAMPFAAPGPLGWIDVAIDGPSESDQRILALMGAGLKDEAIARHLGLGARTVQRRISRLMDVLGANTRFQAGLAAGRRGWL